MQLPKCDYLDDIYIPTFIIERQSLDSRIHQNAKKADNGSPLKYLLKHVFQRN